MLDPSYSNWQPTNIMMYSRTAKTYVKDILRSTPSQLPAGVILTTIQASSMITQTIQTLTQLSDIFIQNRIAASSLKAVTENGFLLILGLLLACDDDLSILQSICCDDIQNTNATTAASSSITPRTNTTANTTQQKSTTTSSSSFCLLIKLLCLEIPHKSVRNGICRRLFECCVSIWQLNSDTTISSSSSPIMTSSDNISIQQKKESRCALFTVIFQSLVLSVISVYETNNTTTNTTTNNTNQNQYIIQSSAEQIFSLLAMLVGLTSAPFISTEKPVTKVFLPAEYYAASNIQVSMNTSRLPCINTTTNNASNTDFKTSFITLFINLLFSYQASTLTTNNSQQESCDGSLLGILRVLIMIASSGDSSFNQALNSLYNNNNNNSNSNNDKIQHTSVISNQQQQSLSSSKTAMTTPMIDLITFLYVNCLFPAKDLHTTGSYALARTAICQSKFSRSLVYYLLYLLVKYDIRNMTHLVNAINTHEQNIAVMSHQWNYNPGIFVKSERADVGLSNQGGTCYMNALLQQIFHVKSFTRALLNIDTSSSLSAMEMYTNALNIETNSKNKEQLSKLENYQILYQLQIVFSYLLLSQKKFYDTLPFCHVIRDYDGEVLRLTEQKDINEFAGMLFDKLESNTEVKNLLSKCFQGKIVWQTRSIETSYRSDREESFYMITAEVKNKSSLEVIV